MPSKGLQELGQLVHGEIPIPSMTLEFALSYYLRKKGNIS
jgi:hypothetical protein